MKTERKIPKADAFTDVYRACHRWLLARGQGYRNEMAYFERHRPPGRGKPAAAGPAERRAG